MATITNPNNRPVVYATDATDDVSISIDYTEYYDRIATALETIATNSTTIANSIDSSSPQIATFTGSISNGIGGAGTVLTVATVSGTISVGMKLIGGSVQPNTYIVSGTGPNYVVSQSQNLSSTTLIGYKINGYITDLISNISSKQTTIADKQSAIETYQKKLKELGEDRGIHVVGPYEWLGLLSIYRLLIEQGKILDESENVSDDKITEALQVVTQYLNKINSLPRQF